MGKISDFLTTKASESEEKSDDLTVIESTNSTRSKRQMPMPMPPPNRLGPQFPDGGLNSQFPDFYDFYPNDFLYDYYDWVCSDTSCQLCNILTSECCDPAVNVNCFLPDSCLNNPCLSGGTCIPTQTLDQRADFICVCYPGFTGKYCQLTNEFFFPPPLPPPPPSYGYAQPSYNYAPPQAPQYAPPPQQAPRYVPPPQQAPPRPPQYAPPQPPQQAPPRVPQYAPPQPPQQAPPRAPQYGGQQGPVPLDRP
jgi:hypothetical protein